MKQLKKSITSIRIDLSNMIEDERTSRDAWRDRWDDTDKARLKELVSLEKRIKRIERNLI